MHSVDELIDSLSAHVDFGHQKRNEAFLRQVAQQCRGGGGFGSAHEGSDSMADAVSAYRFAGNEKISLRQLRATRLEAVLQSSPAEETLLMINDWTELNYYNHESKEDRRAIGDGRGRGYEYVCNLAVSLESERIHGVLHDCVISSAGPDDAEIVDYQGDLHFKQLSKAEPQRLACNHKHQLACHFRYLHQRMPGRRFVVVADREFDDHYFFETVQQLKGDCVIRSNALRNIQVKRYDWLPAEAMTRRYEGLPCEAGYVCADMKKIVSSVPVAEYGQLPLDGKGRHTDRLSAKSWVRLFVGAFQARLYREYKRNKQYFSPRDYVDINVVILREKEEPTDREQICWVLFTTLPVETVDDIRKVAKIYELRWRIECFFKYLKSGYKIEALRYDHADKVARHLVAVTIAACFLLNLKAAIGLPESSSLAGHDYERIKAASRGLEDISIPFQLRLFSFIAMSGGWLGRRNDPISPMTLIKGMQHMLMMITACIESPKFVKELINSPFGRHRNAYNRNAYNR